ncbi:glycosyltransferase family 1 protein [Cupriavidus necator]|uniref:Glycosyltransferase family 1 protein n=1 Tax=Cupriavidus necator TaxID=106590 RepID=A0A1U9UV10_CUPNE|nr:glycosyltransferase family 1 protein [Cupriavidus necator]AQV96490.1 glycosyltransferase family 1 protein [Cupriavidus necator]
MNIVMGGRSLLTPRTGIGQYVYHLERGMAALGHGVRFFYGTHWGPAASAAGGGAPRQVARQTLRNRLSGTARRLARDHMPGLARLVPLVEQMKFNAGMRGQARPQIYHEPNFIPLRCPSPTVITAHDVSWVRYPAYHPAARLALMHQHFPSAVQRADRIIVVSDFVRRELLENFSVDPAKVRVVHNGVSAAFKPQTPAQTRSVLARHGLAHGAYMVAVGTLEPRKNLGTVLDAHARLPAAMQQAFPLVLVGVNGWLNDDLHARLRKPVQAGTVRVLGYAPDADLPALVAGACTLLYPSVYEGFGLPPLEAMACGVPVIASTAGAIQEVVADAGLLHEALDADAFTGSMRRVIEDKALCARLGNAGLERARHFSWQRCVGETLAVYRELLA